jgi:hypothetical protein
MRIPAKRLRCQRSFDGRVEGEGYLVIDLKGLDMDGVTTVVLGLEDVDSARSRSGEQGDARERLRGLLGD